LATVTVIVVVLALLAGWSVRQDIDLAEGERLPASVTSERAHASLLRMQLHVRGYLVVGNKQDIDDYREHKLIFEQNLTKLRALARNGPPEDSYVLGELVGNYEKWIALPQKLFELHDDPLMNRPASRLMHFEVSPRSADVLQQLESLIALRAPLRAGAADAQPSPDLVEFQTSFDAMVTGLAAFAASGETKFKLAYDRHLAATAALWQRLARRRNSLDDAQRRSFDQIQKDRVEIAAVAQQITNIV